MDWSNTDLDRLYELYKDHFHQLRATVIAANTSLGSGNPEKTRMQLMTKVEFEQILTTNDDEPEVAARWVKCIISGHEDEFPSLRVA